MIYKAMNVCVNYIVSSWRKKNSTSGDNQNGVCSQDSVMFGCMEPSTSNTIPRESPERRQTETSRSYGVWETGIYKFVTQERITGITAIQLHNIM